MLSYASKLSVFIFYVWLVLQVFSILFTSATRFFIPVLNILLFAFLVLNDIVLFAKKN